MVNCSPELGAAAMVIVKLGLESYREGKVFHFDRETMTVSDGNPSWAKAGSRCRQGRPRATRARLEGRRHGQRLVPGEVSEARRPVDERRRSGAGRRNELDARTGDSLRNRFTLLAG